MSWSITAPSQTTATIEANAREMFGTQQLTVSGTEEERAATAEQFEAALAAAQSVLASGAVGDTPAFVTLLLGLLLLSLHLAGVGAGWRGRTRG